MILVNRQLIIALSLMDKKNRQQFQRNCRKKDTTFILFSIYKQHYFVELIKRHQMR